jgi:hypothetical protein
VNVGVGSIIGLAETAFGCTCQTTMSAKMDSVRIDKKVRRGHFPEGFMITSLFSSKSLAENPPYLFQHGHWHFMWHLLLLRFRDSYVKIEILVMISLYQEKWVK